MVCQEVEENQMTRREAINAGLLYFSTGKPCKYGHTSERYVGNGACVECLRPSRTALTVISTPGEILVPHTNDRLELQKSRLELDRQRLALQAERQAASCALQVQLLDEKLRRERERSLAHQRKATVKSRLVDVNLLVDPLDYEVIATMVWAAAFMRDPLLRREDVVTGRQLKDSVFVMKCFPEDKKQLLNLTGQMYQARNAVSSAELVSRVETIQRQLTAEVEAENNWPSHDPH